MKKYILPLVIALGLTISACDDYLDINDDPNNPTESMLSSDLILPAMEMNYTASYGNFLRIVGGYFSEQYSQNFGTSNYLPYSQFTMSSTQSSSLGYLQLYLRVISTGQTVIDKANAEGDWGTLLAATTLRGLAFTTMVDCYDSIPYKDCLMGITQPKYDDGKTVYEGVIAEIDDVLSKVKSTNSVATNFLYPNQSAIKWIQFANALKLKLYMRMANVDESYLSKVQEIISANNLPTEDVAYKGCWAENAGAENPYFAEEFATNFGSTQINVIANVTLIGSMQQDNYTDPRLAVFFAPNKDNVFQGGISGTNFSASSGVLSDASFCRPKINYDSPVYLLTLSEIEFFKSEFYARKGDLTNAQICYENAIKESFKSANVEGAENNIKIYPFDSSNWKKSIGLAKYIALSGVNNFEAWCELRRLRYPEFNTSANGIGDSYYNKSTGVYTPNNYVPFTLYTPISVDPLIGNNRILERFPHASASVDGNINTPITTNSTYTTPVFWAK